MDALNTPEIFGGTKGNDTRSSDSFVAPFYHDSDYADEGNQSTPLVAGVLTNANASVSVAPGGATGVNVWTVRFRKNGGGTGNEITCTIEAAQRSCTAVGALTFDNGDLLSVQFDEGGTSSSAAATRMAFSADYTETVP